MLSNAEVASSKSKIYGFLIIALAMATLCFCPPDIWEPLIPTSLSNPLLFDLLYYYGFTFC